MKPKEDLGEFSPLLYYLQKNQIPELIRVMFNRKLSQQYLQRYGHSIDPPLRRTEQSRLQEYVRKFEGREIVHLKGSHSENVKYHVNTFVQECLRRKIRRDGLLAHEERRVAWLQLTECYQQPFLFAGLDQIELPPFTRTQIKKDVDRTQLSDDIKAGMSPTELKMRMGEIHSQLTNVLEAFAKYNPYIGYLQGMNNIVLFLLQQGFSEQQSFFLLKKITEQLLPCDYLSTMNSIHSLIMLLCEVLVFTHPQAVKQMKLIVLNNQGEGMSYVLSFAYQWFVCLFTNINLNRDVRRCIFDHFLLEGLPTFLKAALCFFDAIQPAIARTTLLQEFSPTADKVIRGFNSINLLKQRLNDTYVNKTIFNLIIDKFTLPLQKRKKRQCKRVCDHRWTMCLQTIQQNFVKGYHNQFFVFRTTQQPKIIQNYLDVNTRNRTYFRIGKNYNRTANLLIGHMQHCCRPVSGTSQTEDLQSNKQQFQGENSSVSKSKYSDSPPSKLSGITKRQELQEPERRQMVRNKALQQLYTMHNERQSKIMRSESMQFMMHMIKNQSFTNLMDILQVKNMEDLFRDCISQAEEDDQDSNL